MQAHRGSRAHNRAVEPLSLSREVRRDWGPPRRGVGVVGGDTLASRGVARSVPPSYKVIRRRVERTESDPRDTAMPYVLTMADEIPRDALLDRVKEQGEVVRRLKAAKADNTKVRGHPSPFLPLSTRILGASRPRDRCTSFLHVREGVRLRFALNYTLSSCHLHCLREIGPPHSKVASWCFSPPCVLP